MNYKTTQNFAGKSVLVTGAGKGLGKAYALWFARHGAAVVVNNRSLPGTGSSARAVADAIVAEGGKAIADDHPVEDEVGAKAMVAAAVEAFGGLDVLVCNAGIAPLESRGPLETRSMADFRHVMDVNFYGTLYVLTAALPHLYASGRGRFIGTTSSGGFFPSPFNCMYASSKTALIGLIRGLSREGVEHGFRANLISPMALTPMAAPYFDAKYKALLDEDHVAKVVGWLGSEECDLNGEILVAGGDMVYRATVVQTPGQPIGDRDVGVVVRALDDLSQAVEVPHSNATVEAIIAAYDLVQRS